jgi:hypothetical protein
MNGEEVGQSTQKDSITREIFQGLTFFAAGIFVAELGSLLYRTDQRIKKEQEFVPPQGAHEELAPVANRFALVYEGQNQPRCAGDIEKVVLLKNAAGELRGLNVICKPEAAEPAK